MEMDDKHSDTNRQPHLSCCFANHPTFHHHHHPHHHHPTSFFFPSRASLSVTHTHLLSIFDTGTFGNACACSLKSLSAAGAPLQCSDPPRGWLTYTLCFLKGFTATVCLHMISSANHSQQSQGGFSPLFVVLRELDLC